jgi:hypothetical protein
MSAKRAKEPFTGSLLPALFVVPAETQEHWTKLTLNWVHYKKETSLSS